jgi:hypothetical protein
VRWRNAWRIVCAGGYFAAGFNGTIGHSDVWNRIDPPNHYTFTVKDEGAAAQLGALYDFFAALPFWRMQPFADVSGDAIVLAEPGKAYVAYLPHGGSMTLDLTEARGAFNARWFNPRTGEFGVPFRVPGNGRRSFEAPDNEDWALQLQPSA